MIYQHWSRNIKVAQILELIFFSIIIGAFILLIPMKARAEESKFRGQRGGDSLAFYQASTGEKMDYKDSLNSDRLSQVLEWSNQFATETDRGQGEKE